MILQEKGNQEIDLTFKLKSLHQSLEQEEAEHKTTKAKLADKNHIYQSIEEAKSEALKGESKWEVKSMKDDCGMDKMHQLMVSSLNCD